MCQRDQVGRRSISSVCIGALVVVGVDLGHQWLRKRKRKKKRNNVQRRRERNVALAVKRKERHCQKNSFIDCKKKRKSHRTTYNPGFTPTREHLLDTLAHLPGEDLIVRPSFHCQERPSLVHHAKLHSSPLHITIVKQIPSPQGIEPWTFLPRGDTMALQGVYK